MEEKLLRYAWKISGGGRQTIEAISTLNELEAVLVESILPGDIPAAEIIRRTKLMQYERQGVYKSRMPEAERWTLLWIELG